MTMQCSPLVRSAAPLLAIALALAGCAKEDTLSAEMQPPGMTSMPTNMGMMMPGSMMMTPAKPGGTAALKFCNAIGGPGGAAVKVELVVGGVRLEAASGTCAPVDLCSSVPAGNAHLTFSMGGKEVLARDIALEANQQYVVLADLERGSEKVVLAGGKLQDGVACAKANPFSIPAVPPSNGAVGKFCHALMVQGQGDVELDLTIGAVKLHARTGDCSSPQGQMCTALPAGMQTAQLSFMSQVVATLPVNIDPTRQYLFDVDLVNMMPVITAEALPAGASCAMVAGGSAPPPPTGMASVKFCNRLPAAGGMNVAELTVGATTLTAKPGSCSPMLGAACPTLPSGVTTLSLAIDGEDEGDGNIELPAAPVTLSLVRDPQTGMIGIQGRAVPGGMMCSAFEPQ